MKILDQKYAKDYILAGKALVTFHNTKTGNQFTYLIKQKRDKISRELFPRWYINHNKTYLGYIDDNNFYFGSNISNVIIHSIPMAVWVWVWQHITTQTVPDFIEILRSDFCGHCGRQLTEARSLEIGIGPECRRKLGIE